MSSMVSRAAETGPVTIERVVVLLTPVFAGVSGWLVGWAADHLPGHPALSASDVTAIEITGVVAATSAVLKWLHGRQIPALVSGIALDPRVAREISLGAGAGPQGPPGEPGSPGVTPEQVRAFVDDEVRQSFARFASVQASAPPAQ